MRADCKKCGSSVKKPVKVYVPFSLSKERRKTAMNGWVCTSCGRTNYSELSYLAMDRMVREDNGG